MSASKKLQFWFEFASTYSYPAAMRIEVAAAQAGVTIEWKPFMLGPIFKRQGWTDSPFNLFPAKGQYMWRDFERICQGMNLPLKKPSAFPRNGLLAARIACLYANESWIPGFVRAIYTANFAYDLDISSPAVIAHCLHDLGQTPDVILSAAQEPDAKEKLIRQTQSAMNLGIFGSPSFIAGDELFWGNDRLSEAIAWCASGHPPK